MIGKHIRTYAIGIGRGYKTFLQSAIAAAGGLAVVVGLSAIIVTPLWLLATKHTTAYTALALGGIAGAWLYFTVYRICTQEERRKRFLRRILKTAIFAGGVALFYVVFLLYSRGIYAAAVPLSICLVALVGLLLHGKIPGRP